MNQSSLPSIEIIQGAAVPDTPVDTRRGPRRVIIFIAVFAFVTLLGMVWNFSRPAIYRSAATVLTVKPKAIDTRSADADLEHVAIQGRTLMDSILLRGVAA